MPKLKLLILDANVVIYLHEKSLWRPVLERCEVFLSRLVAEHEVRYYHGRERDQIIDLTPDIEAGVVQVFEVSVSSISDFAASSTRPIWAIWTTVRPSRWPSWSKGWNRM